MKNTLEKTVLTLGAALALAPWASSTPASREQFAPSEVVVEEGDDGGETQNAESDSTEFKKTSITISTTCHYLLGVKIWCSETRIVSCNALGSGCPSTGITPGPDLLELLKKAKKLKELL